jgi:hypothetical protein
MSFKKIFCFLSVLPLIPVAINHFDIEINNKQELFDSVDHIKKGSKGLLRFSYNQIKEILEGD